jgi:ubiquinone/menaquinone biosynthesis C-methylase UbiE
MAGAGLKKSHYIIRGGVAGRERLRVLARGVRLQTLELLDRAGIRPGMTCLDAGCGGGDVSFDLARLVGPTGRVVGVDMDEIKLEMARNEAAQQRLENVEFRHCDVCTTELQENFDLVHARFLLSHLPNPNAAIVNLRKALRPGGVLVTTDTDFRGFFSEPPCPALSRFVELYTETVRRRGGNANLGPRLPRLLREAGFHDVQMNVFQQANTDDVRQIVPLTMESISEAVLAEGLATSQEIERVVSELYEFARDPDNVLSSPRGIEAWGRIEAC